jgi:hypothetical protein
MLSLVEALDHMLDVARHQGGAGGIGAGTQVSEAAATEASWDETPPNSYMHCVLSSTLDSLQLPQTWK